MKKILALLLLFVTINSCERDDICAESTPTTPHLVIEFYDITDQSETKRVIDLQIQGVDNDEVYQYAISSDIIQLPLKTNDVVTKFKLHKEYEEDADGSIIGGNEDIISITYNPTEIYVSRACGYKTIFENVQIDIETDGDDWIELIQVDEPLIVDNETETHVQIYH